MVRVHVINNKNRQKSGNFIALACEFKSEILAFIAGEEINAKSIMKAPVIDKAVEIDFIIKGEDAKEAADAIALYFETKESEF